MKETTKTYGKYILTGAAGIGLGLGYATVSDTPTEQTQLYQNLKEDLNTSKSNADDLESQVKELQTTVTDKEERVSNLESQVQQFNTTIEQLRAENENLQDAVPQVEERVGLVDYLPVFSDSDVEFQNDIAVTVDQEVTNGEGDYDEIDVNYKSDDGQYDVAVREYEESEDAEDAIEDFEETQTPVEFSADEDEHTITLNGYTGTFSEILFEYDDFDAIEDVDNEDDVLSVVVDGEDITDRVQKVEQSGDDIRLHLDEDYYVNDGESITVTYGDVSDEGDLTKVRVNDGAGYGSDYTYDQDDDVTEEIYRDGNTVVEITGEDKGDEFEAQYEDLASQYE